MYTVALVLLCVVTVIPPVAGLNLSVLESVPVGHVIGFVEGRAVSSVQPVYYIVYSNAETEKTLKVDDRNGEISTLTLLDYERAPELTVLAIPIAGGDPIEITVEVEDENDHAPTFPMEKTTLEISEYARIGSEYPLPSASDGDGHQFRVQKYQIAQGNVNNVFKLATRLVNDVLHVDLVVNGQIDREYRDKYDLILEAIDGGKPPKVGRLRVQVHILDANDNTPIFEKQRYSVSVSPSLNIGSQVLTVKASDEDVGENGRVTYRLRKSSSASIPFFSLTSLGVLSTTAHLLPGSIHDLVVLAADHGTPSLESTAFITITVQGSSLTSPPLDIIWLTESASPHFFENITLGSILGRVALNEQQRESKLSLTGCPSLCLQQSDTSHIYLLLVCGLFDRETNSEYHLKFMVKKDGELVLDHPVLLTIADVNDNAPSFPQNQLHISLNRSREANDVVLRAVDPDQGQNGRIRYSLKDTELVLIDPDTGRITLSKDLDCSVGDQIRFKVEAKDTGVPQLASQVEVVADLLDVSARPPQFTNSLYEVSVKEDVEKGTCLLKVETLANGCGSSARVRYSMKEDSRLKKKLFSLDSVGGTICLDGGLDYEIDQLHQFTVQATDINGFSGLALVSIRVIDVNDNAPVFYPNTYNTSVRGGTPIQTPLLTLHATDKDNGKNGEVNYSIIDDVGWFRIDSKTGELYQKKKVPEGNYEILVDATDVPGTTAEQKAIVHISVLGGNVPTPVFTQSKYIIQTSEEILPGIVIGAIQAKGDGNIKYNIYSGDSDHQFSIDKDTGRIAVAKYLDADKADSILLNVQASMEFGGTAHAQVIVLIEDHNDNAPQFTNDIVEVTIREDHPTRQPFYVLHAEDKDRKKNGLLLYSIISTHPLCPIYIEPNTGKILLNDNLNYERTRDYRIRVKATDQGIPPKAANMTIVLHVTDVNDNAPQFEKTTYKAKISESSEVMSEVIQVHATDMDSEQNAQVRYRITNGSQYFAIDELSGIIRLLKQVDREKQTTHKITVIAEDKGLPPLHSSVEVLVTVLDVNDNAPSCTSLQPLVVPANAKPGTPFGSIIISDPDMGENGTVVYRSQQPHPLFILSFNGDVTLRRELLPSDASDFRLSVIASDGGTPKKSAVCHVPVKINRGISRIELQQPFESVLRAPPNCIVNCFIRMINATNVKKWIIQSSEYSSHFSLFNGQLVMLSEPSTLPPWKLTLILQDEQNLQKHLSIKVMPPFSKNLRQSLVLSPSLPIGSKIAVVAPRVKDENSYYIMTNHSDLFELDQSTGVVYLAARLRGLGGRSIATFFKKINNITRETEEIVVQFDVTPNSVEVPRFAKQIMEITVVEDSQIDSIITTTIATVFDTNSTVQYRLTTSSIDYFSIDQYSGDIILTKELDWFEQSEHHLVIEASTSQAKSTMLLLVKVKDTNNHRPLCQTENEIILTADIEKGSSVHHMGCTDQDERPYLTYELREGQEHFEIDSKNGIIRLVSNPTEDMKLRVVVNDNGIPRLHTEKTINVRVVSNLDRWRYFDAPTQMFNISTYAKPGANIGNIKHGGLAKLRVLSIPEYFELKEDHLLIKSPVPAGQYYTSVIATSPTGAIDWLTVLVKATIPLDGPRISSASCGAVTVPENRINEYIKRILITGATQDVKFSLQNAASEFTIDALTGVISSSELDREKSAEHLLVVVAEQQDKQDTCTVRVRVLDDNDNAPQFAATTPQHLKLQGGLNKGDILVTLTAHDDDSEENGRITYELLEDPSRTLDINPQTGDVIYARQLAYKENEWMIRVRAVDHGTESKSTDRFIRVKDGRNKIIEKDRPQFVRSQYITNVNEGLERGLVIAALETTASRDAPLTYSIVEGNLDSAFDIDNFGVLRTAQELDYEIRPDYHLRVVCGGAFTQEMSTIIDVGVNNQNDNPPIFPKLKNRKILESIPVGTYITTVTATDADHLGILEYSFDGEQRQFSIEKYTGIIHLLEPLDYETEKEVEVKVKVFDGKFEAFASFRISVIDVNDNTPQFFKSFYDIQIPISAQPDDAIHRLLAQDSDSGENAKISFEVIGTEAFTVNHEGSLILSHSLFSSDEHIFVVRVSDNGTPRLSSTAIVRVTVTQENKERRIFFENSEYEISASESVSPYLPFGNISVGGSDRPLWYRILDAEAGRTFTVDRFGRISARTRLDRETTDIYSFEVDVSCDDCSYSTNSTTRVVIRVLDKNDNNPTFNVARMEIQLRDGLRNGDVLQRLSAQDADIGENGRVRYSILSGNDDRLVTVTPDSGLILFNELNDESLINSNGIWTVVVEAKDFGSPARSCLLYLDLFVVMSSSAATAPFFLIPHYVTHIHETAQIATHIHQMRAVNKINAPMKGLTYSLSGDTQTFFIDPLTGIIRVQMHLDYETRPRYTMTVTAVDASGRAAVASLEVFVDAIDEYPPIFTQQKYVFQVPVTLSTGASIGFVKAVDADGGPDGEVKYELEGPPRLFKVEATTGEILLLNDVPNQLNATVEQLTVVARSGTTQRNKVNVFIEIGIQQSSLGSSLLSVSLLLVTVSILSLICILAIVLLTCCVFSKRTQVKQVDNPRKQVYSVSRGRMEDLANIHENLPRPPLTKSYSIQQQAQAKTASMTSSLSTSSGLRSALSNRDFTTRSQPDSGIDPDTVSINSSVTEYLTSIGVNPNPIIRRNRFNRSMMESPINELIYARVDDVIGDRPLDMRPHGGSFETNSFMPMTTGPPGGNMPLPYTPLTEIFSEITRLQREEREHPERADHQRRDYVQIEI